MKTNKPGIVVFQVGFCLIFWNSTLKFINELVDEVRKSTEPYSVQGLHINHYYAFLRPIRLTLLNIVDFFRSLNKIYYSSYYMSYTIFKEEIIWNPRTNYTNTMIIK